MIYAIPFQTLGPIIDEKISYSGADIYLSPLAIYDVLVSAATELYAVGYECTAVAWYETVAGYMSDLLDGVQPEDFSGTGPMTNNEIDELYHKLTVAMEKLIGSLVEIGDTMMFILSPLKEPAKARASIVLNGFTPHGDLLVQVGR